MRRVQLSTVLAFACLSAASASATGVRVNDGHTVADFGVGGWTQHSSGKPFAGGAVSAGPSVTNDVVDFHSSLDLGCVPTPAVSSCRRQPPPDIAGVPPASDRRDRARIRSGFAVADRLARADCDAKSERGRRLNRAV